MCYYYMFKKASTNKKSLFFLSHFSPVFWGLTGSIARKDLQNSFVSLCQCRMIYIFGEYYHGGGKYLLGSY
jgi:hypothetical protein